MRSPRSTPCGEIYDEISLVRLGRRLSAAGTLGIDTKKSKWPANWKAEEASS